ncbi:MAG: hypothetical protein JXR50_08280 [Prolixibacteraceae bacterium]|nr:hypothetical protein [Prolixibacteraceae bacterium]MBN2649721.1 hypothetical protein [Prolixibacteraceae bacterium]
MKTSKKIFIIFFSLLGLFLLSLLIQIDPNKQKSQFEEKEITFPPFEHLVLFNCGKIDLQEGSSNTAWNTVVSDSLAQMPEYELKSDTLVLSWTQDENSLNRTIYCKNLRSISIENSKIHIYNLHVDSLSCYAVNGVINYDVNHTTTDSHTLEMLQIKLEQNSLVNVNGRGAKFIEADISQSIADIRLTQTDTLKATLRNNSNLSTYHVLKTEVDSDASSRYFSREN